jgi:hypothetical protein
MQQKIRPIQGPFQWLSVRMLWSHQIPAIYLCVTYGVSLMERDHKCFSFILFETKLIPFVPFYISFSLTVFVQLHCIAISLEMSSLCVYLQLWRSLNMPLCVPLHECIAKVLQRFLFVFDILSIFLGPSIVSCVLMFPLTLAQLNAKVQTLMHILWYLVVP